jgi:hypothetical protein
MTTVRHRILKLKFPEPLKSNGQWKGGEVGASTLKVSRLKPRGAERRSPCKEKKFGGAGSSKVTGPASAPRKDDYGSIETFILKQQQGNLETLTEGISPSI